MPPRTHEWIGALWRGARGGAALLGRRAAVACVALMALAAAVVAAVT